jgi:WD40 repeat protein
MLATCVATLDGKSRNVYSVAFHPTEPLLATGNFSNNAKLWRLSDDNSSATCVATLNVNDSTFYSVAFHPTAPLLATTINTPRDRFNENTVKIWRFSPDGSVENNMLSTCVATLNDQGDHVNFINSVSFHPTAPLLATGSSDFCAKIWRISPDGSAATCVATLKGHPDMVCSVAFHPTAPLLATGSYDKTVKLWRFSPDGSEANNMRASCVETLTDHLNYVNSVAFHPNPRMPLLAAGTIILDKDGKTILQTDSSKNNAKIWELNLNKNSRLNYHNQNEQNAGSLQNESRFFKLVRINGKEVDGGRYELPSKTKSGKEQTRGPKDKASIAFSEICKKNNKKGECSYKFAIQETTRGSNKKVYHYEGKRVKLTKPIVLELKDKKVVIKYKNVITPIQ